MWRENRTFFGGLNLEQLLAYRKCGETNRTFFGGLNLEQFRKCGEKIALFLRSEPGTGARLQKMWRENRTFFGGLNLEQLLAYRKCGEKIALFLAV